MRFKHLDIQDELIAAHPRLVALALYADWWASRNLSKDLLVTDVSRSQAEYDTIYADKIAEGTFFVGTDGIKHYSGPRPHLADPLRGVPGHAIDFRTIGEMGSVEIGRIADHLNATWPRADKKPTALYHDVTAAHLHVQAEV